MKNYIAIDGGTTNTRLTLLSDGKVKEKIRLRTGVKNNIESTKKYEKEICGAIAVMAEKYEIEHIICSGMITSELGLCPLKHLSAPCGIKELHEEMYITKLADIPTAYIRGVKLCGNGIENTDVMRGEETELFGIADVPECGALYILPGSHSKHIYTDSLGRIKSFSTQLSGELINAAANHTILKECVNLNLSGFDAEYLQKGYAATQAIGINAAVFKARLLKTLFDLNEKEIYSYFIGCMLSVETASAVNSAAQHIIIGGKQALKAPMAHLLKCNSKKNVTAVSDGIADNASAIGALRIFLY